MAVTAGTFTEGTSTLTMSGAATTIRFTAPRQPYNLFIAPGAGNTVSVLTDDLTVGNTLTVTNGTFATNSTSLTVTGATSVAGTLTGSTAPDTITANGGLTATGTVNLNGGDLSTTNLTVSGTLAATAAAPAETITVTGNIDFSNAGDNFTQDDSTILMAGATTPATINAAGEDGFHHLTVNKSAAGDIVRLLTALALDNGSGVLTLTTGTLELNGHPHPGHRLHAELRQRHPGHRHRAPSTGPPTPAPSPSPPARSPSPPAP